MEPAVGQGDAALCVLGGDRQHIKGKVGGHSAGAALHPVECILFEINRQSLDGVIYFITSFPNKPVPRGASCY